jgi:hypothetical protein
MSWKSQFSARFSAKSFAPLPGVSSPCRAIALLVCLVCLVSPSWAQSLPDASAGDPGAGNGRLGGIENVFIIVMDGVRCKEAFDDPTHQYIPRIWNDLRPLGTIYTDFINAGQTATTAGHAAMVTGVTQHIPNTLLLGVTEIEILQQDPSIFQYYRSQLGIPQNKTWLINGKGPMIENVGICHHPLYGDDFSPSVSFTEKTTDSATWTEVESVIDTYHPSLTMINLKDVDEAGHARVWQDYVDAIVDADTIVYDICQKILNDPHYQNNTVIFITSDHGRHLDNVSTAWRDHGCACQGCRRIPFLAIGPGIKVDTVIESDEGRLCDLAPTVAYLLDFDARFSQGRILREIFETPPPAESNAMSHPAVAYASGKIHVACCRHIGRDSQIIYANSSNNGQSWNNATVLSPGKNHNLQPSITTLNDRVAVSWSEYQADGSYGGIVRVSTNSGSSWGQKISLPGNKPRQEDLNTDITPLKNWWGTYYFYTVWTEQEYEIGYLNIAEIKNSYVSDSDSFTSDLMDHPRCASSSDDIHVVYEQIDTDYHNWDIWYCRYDGSSWKTPMRLCQTDDDSLAPDVAADDSDDVYVVWAEEKDGKFEIRFRKSTNNGSSWSSYTVISQSSEGAWRPRISSGGGTLAVVWEGVEAGNSVLFRRKSTNDGDSWRSVKTITSNSLDSFLPAQTVNSNEVLHAFWMDGSWPTAIGFTDIQL